MFDSAFQVSRFNHTDLQVHEWHQACREHGCTVPFAHRDRFTHASLAEG